MDPSGHDVKSRVVTHMHPLGNFFFMRAAKIQRHHMIF